MLHGLLKQHQVHDGVQLVVVLQRVTQGLVQLLPVRHAEVARLTHAMGKVAVDQRLVDKDGLVYTLQQGGGTDGGMERRERERRGEEK